MNESYKFILWSLVTLAVLIPALQITPFGFMELQTAHAQSSIVLNNINSTNGTTSGQNQVILSDFTVGTGQNRLLVVGIEADFSVESIKFGNADLTQAVWSFETNDAELWYLKNPNGTKDIVVTMDAPASVVVGAYSLAGVDQSNPVPTTATNTGNSNSPSVTITTQHSNSMVIDSAAIFGFHSLSSPSCTERWNHQNVDGPNSQEITGASSSTIQGTAGQVTCSWTASDVDTWDSVAIEVKSAASIVLNGTSSTTGTTSSTNNQVTLSNFNVGTGQNRLLVVGVEASGNGATSITFGGTQLTKAVSSFVTNDAELWYLKNPNGTGNIVVTMSTFNPQGSSVVVGAYSFFGVDQNDPIPTTATNNGNSASPTVTITTQHSNSWVVDSASIFGGKSLSNPTCTQRWIHNGVGGGLGQPQSITGASSSTIKEPAGQVSCSWTASGADFWDSVAIEVKSAGAIVLNGTSSTGDNTSVITPITISGFNVGTGDDRLLLVGVEASTSGVSSVKFGQANLTNAVWSFVFQDAQLWYLKNPNGTADIVVMMDGAASVVAGAYSFSGVNQTDPIPTTAKNNGTESSPTISITTKHPNSWVVDSAAIFGFKSLTNQTCTERWNHHNVGGGPAQNVTGASSSTIQETAGQVTCSWTASEGDFWDSVAVEVREAAAASVPGAPTGLTATAQSESEIDLSWTAPSNNGGSAITGYKIERTGDGGTIWNIIEDDTGSTSTSYPDVGLAQNTAYQYRVSAINSVGTGSPSDTDLETTNISLTNWTSSTGIFIPLFFDPHNFTNPPTTFTWQTVNDTKNEFPHVPIFGVANPASGPGFFDPPNCHDDYPGHTRNYINAIGNLTNAGVIMLGYVPTGQGSVSTANVQGNITNWVSCYPNIQGIFLDEMPNFDKTGFENHYRNITSFIHNNASLKYSIGNSGSDLPITYNDTVDRIIIHEGLDGDPQENSSKLTNETLQGNGVPGNPPNWHTLFDKSKFSFVQFNKATLPQSQAQANSTYVGLMYFTDNTGCGTVNEPTPCLNIKNETGQDPTPCPPWCLNPWNTTSSHFNDMASFLSTTSILSTIQAFNKTTSTLFNLDKFTIHQSDNLVRNGTTPFSYNSTSGWQFKFTAPNSTGTLCHWTFPGGNVINSTSVLITPTENKNYTAVYGC